MENWVVYAWIFAGLSLMMAEIVVPGLIVIFLGMAALLVALGISLGFLNGWMPILSAWFICSLVLIFSLRNLFARLAPGETSRGNMDEDLEAIGRLVEVIKDVHPYDDKGRILFRGSSWAATCPQTTVKQGERVRLLRRQLNLWIVEPVVSDRDAEPTTPKEETLC